MESLVDRYRPQILEDYIGQPHIVPIIRGMATTGNWALTYLLHGSYGCGKTSLARMIAKYINCSHPKENGDPCNTCKACINLHKNVIEINGSNKRKIDDIRNLIVQSTLRSNFKHRVIIIDEAHMLTPQAQQAILKPLEDNKGKTIWIIVTTDPQQLLPTIKSRCQSFKVKPVPIDVLSQKMLEISQKEGKPIDIKILETIASKTEGHVRDSFMILNQVLTSMGSNINIDDLVDNILTTSITLAPSIIAKKLLGSIYSNGKYSESFLALKAIGNVKIVWEELLRYNEEAMNLMASPKLVDPYKRDWHKVIQGILNAHKVKNNKFGNIDLFKITIGIHKILLKTYKELMGWETDKLYIKVPIIEAIDFAKNYTKEKV